MKTSLNKHLFWFLKDGVEIDLEKPSDLDPYVQQIITYGRTDDIKKLLKQVNILQLKLSIKRLNPFLPLEIRRFWENFFGNNK